MINFREPDSHPNLVDFVDSLDNPSNSGLSKLSTRQESTFFEKAGDIIASIGLFLDKISLWKSLAALLPASNPKIIKAAEQTNGAAADVLSMGAECEARLRDLNRLRELINKIYETVKFEKGMENYQSADKVPLEKLIECLENMKVNGNNKELNGNNKKLIDAYSKLPRDLLNSYTSRFINDGQNIQRNSLFGDMPRSSSASIPLSDHRDDPYVSQK